MKAVKFRITTDLSNQMRIMRKNNRVLKMFRMRVNENTQVSVLKMRRI